jgi:hypothetical protein
MPNAIGFSNFYGSVAMVCSSSFTHLLFLSLLISVVPFIRCTTLRLAG